MDPARHPPASETGLPAGEVLTFFAPAFTLFNLALFDWILAAAAWLENPKNGLGPVKSSNFIDLILAAANELERNHVGLDEEKMARLQARLDEILGEDGEDARDGEEFAGEEDGDFKKTMMRMMEEMLRAEGWNIDLSDVDPDDFDALNARAKEALGNTASSG